MRSLRDRESMQRGSPDYPLDYYLIDRNHPRYEMPYHWHAETELLHVISGQFSMTIDEETFLLAAGDAVYIAPGRLHGGKPENCVYECIVFDMHQLMKTNAFCRPLMTDIESRRVDIFPCFSVHAHELRPVVEHLFRAAARREEGWALITLGCLFTFFGAAYRLGAYRMHDAPPDRESRNVLKLKTVFELMESRLDHPPTLRELSASIGMSPKYFCRFFKLATHQTPMEYLSYYRIEQACLEMSTTDKNVTEIALDLGYGELNYFIRCFKKHKGVTPKKYMDSVRP